MKVVLLLITTLSFSAVMTEADVIAITEDGKKATLKSDGTWEYLPDSDKAQSHGGYQQIKFEL